MKKFKINIDRPKPSSDEILSRRNFDNLMNMYNAVPGKVVHKPFWKSGWAISSFAAAAVIATVIAVYVNRTDVSENKTEPQQVVNTNVQPGNNAPVTNNTAANTVQKRHVAPPLGGLNVPYASYSVNSSNGGVFTHPSGSKLTIPANAFVDENGNHVTGNVEIRYREFRDPVDVFLAGIPMDYDSAGTTYQFESAGMMEVAAFVNGKVVYLDKNKNVQVEFASNNNDPKFNLYRFDTTAGNWVYEGKDKVQPSGTNDNTRHFTNNQVVTNAQMQHYAAVRDSSVQAAAKNYPVPAEPVKPLKADKTKNRFFVGFDSREFPEMAAYKDAMFEVDESKQKFDRNNYNITWDDMALSRGDKEGKYVLTLKKGLQVVKLDVYPVFDGDKYDKAMNVYDQKFAEYQQALNQRTNAEAAARDQYTRMCSGLSMSGSSNYYGTDNSRASQDKSSEVMRMFTISQFGMYNCDVPEMLPQGARVDLSANDANGNLMSGFYTMYHVDREKFSLYSYHNMNPLAGFSFNPKSSNLVWAVKDGALYYADNDQFASMKHSGKTAVEMKPVGRDFASADDMKKFFGIAAKD
ncbi:MAG TPA: hypothetical protein VFU15_12245 [Bacteroidia bacterium]|nr:hypothetical protein [Bacteroidia bacterium]